MNFFKIKKTPTIVLSQPPIQSVNTDYQCEDIKVVCITEDKTTHDQEFQVNCFKKLLPFKYAQRHDFK